MKIRQRTSLFLVTFILFFFQNCDKGFETDTSGVLNSASSGTTQPPVIPPPPSSSKLVDVFVASGHMGRTLMSCDDGLTWINDRSDNDNARCWVSGDPNYVECDHSPYASRGIISSEDGWLFAGYGWGKVGSVRRSRDGVNWTIIKNDNWGNGPAFSNGVLFIPWGKWAISKNFGVDWEGVPDSPYKELDYAEAKSIGSNIYVFSRSRGMMFTENQGQTWIRPVFETAWGPFIAEGNGILLTLGSKKDEVDGNYVGYAARSTDGGHNWQVKEIFRSTDFTWNGDLIFDGQKFVSWTVGKTWTSTDGINWSNVPINVLNFSNKIVGKPIGFNSATGTYIASLSPFGKSYTSQIILRSQDGVNWTPLDDKKYKKGHPIRQIVSGKIEERYCP